MRGVGFYFGAVQFFFATTWTVYAIYLPQLAAQAGIPKAWVIFLLMADQAIFALMDLAMGIASDRMARVVGRLGKLVVALTAVSCLAFLALPLVAPQGSPALLIAVTVVWTLTSSALRAPPMVLLGKYVPKPAVPAMAALLLFGMGMAEAVAPYLAVTLRGIDPRLPFALASLALVLAASAMLWAEKKLVATPMPPRPPARPLNAGVLAFFGAVALLGLGFQVHSALNAGPQYLRFAQSADLEYLMPVFWLGFGLLMLPASRASARFGGVAVMAAGGLIGALASWLAASAGSLATLVTLQFLAGGAWGAVLMSATAAAIAIGSTGREGAATGGLWTLLAVATFARMALVAAQLHTDALIKPLLAWLPAALWATAALVLVALVARSRSAAQAGALGRSS